MPNVTKHQNELVALKTVKTFNDLASRAAAKGSETLELIWKAGETAKQAKAAIPHGEWMSFVETHYDVSHDTVTRWIKFHDTVPESKLRSVRNLTAGIKMLEPPKSSSEQPNSKGKPGGAESSSETPPVADGPASSAATETEDPSGFYDAEETRILADRYLGPTDTEKCPVCASVKWEKYTDGEGWVCSKCRHYYGEPAGDPDDDAVRTLIQKTRKTLEAAMRCFDDLHHVCPSGKHHESIQWCKALLKLLAEWNQ